MRRILALATNPEIGASTRFRVLQWAPVLEAAGFHLSLDAFFSNREAETLYRPGRLTMKTRAILAGTVRRAACLARAARDADLLFIHREAFPLGWRVLFRAIERFPGPVVYDYDDAMFLPQRRGLLGRLEDPATTDALLRRSDVVLAGNEFLADYARRYARRVVPLPTCIDTRRFAPIPRSPRWDGLPTVGWIGSHSTAKYLHSLTRVLAAVGRRVPFRLYVVGSQQRLSVDGVPVEHGAWSLAREVEDFARCDVGIYPLWDDAWAQGKCGFKAIQFMACGVPVVAAAVGVNRQIIRDGVDGCLVSAEAQWMERLTQLLEDPALRAQLGQAGRKRIEAAYSLEAHVATLISALRGACDGRS